MIDQHEQLLSLQLKFYTENEECETMKVINLGY